MHLHEGSDGDFGERARASDGMHMYIYTGEILRVKIKGNAYIYITGLLSVTPVHGERLKLMWYSREF